MRLADQCVPHSSLQRQRTRKTVFKASETLERCLEKKSLVREESCYLTKLMLFAMLLQLVRESSSTFYRLLTSWKCFLSGPPSFAPGMLISRSINTANPTLQTRNSRSL